MKFFKRKDKDLKLKPIRIVGGLLTASMLMFGTVSCNNSANEEAAVEEEGYEVVEDQNFDAGLEETEVANTEVGGDFDEWDVNNDTYLDENEFETVANDVAYYDEWDADDDGLLSDNELYDGVYGVYDEDEDGNFTEDEFNAWNTAWGGEYEYNDWDANDDGFLDSEEYTAGVEDEGVFNDWDTDNDGFYAANEVNAGLYDTWDYDEDGYIENEEYETIGYNLWGF